MAEETYHIDLTDFYEPIEIRPLLNDHIVTHGTRTYRVERHQKGFTKISFTEHCYVFIDITINAKQHKKPFAKKPSVIQEMINNKKLIITNTIYTIWK